MRQTPENKYSEPGERSRIMTAWSVPLSTNFEREGTETERTRHDPRRRDHFDLEE